MSNRPKFTGDPILDQFVEVAEYSLGPDDLEPMTKLTRAFKQWWNIADKPKDKERLAKLNILRKIQNTMYSALATMKATQRKMDELAKELKRMADDYERASQSAKRTLNSFSANFAAQIVDVKESMTEIKSEDDLKNVVKHLDILNQMNNRNKLIEPLIKEYLGEEYEERKARAIDQYQKVKDSRKLKKADEVLLKMWKGEKRE